ncbi:ATP-binding protein [Microbacteriaceae bacterium]|nr:ATP-binding protein [Candidatus Saccharibacteria bacterium]
MNFQLFVNPSSSKAKRFTVTVFGAESTGKTTLSQQLAKSYRATWLHEFARPYLELTHKPISPESMTAIWHGQYILQTMASGTLVIQDTDLFSTLGYWQFPHWRSVLGACPEQLIQNACTLQSDLYLITPSTIPFEADSLRYDGDHREGSDEYWVNVRKHYNLPYVILESRSQKDRLAEARHIINHHLKRSLTCVAL